MGLFDSLFGPRLPEVTDSEQLRKLLFDAALAGDQKHLAGLCQKYQKMILRHFVDWQKVPESVRTDQNQTGRYARGLIAVAEVFAQRLGQQELLQRLMGPAESNPLLRWQEALQQARTMMGELQYSDAAEFLNNLLIDVSGLQGSGADSYLPVTYGWLGECYFQGGEAAKAITPMHRALELCDRNNDEAGVTAYLGNLYEVHRYLSQPEPAARFAERLAEHFAKQGKPDEAAWYRKQAKLVRVGEPRNRVVAVANDRRLELDEVLPIKDGRVQFIFERNRTSLHPSRVWTQRGEQDGSAGRFAEALVAFREAVRADPFDPHPRYLAGLSLLHLKRAAEAVEEHEAVEELAPGWFHCRADLWLARQIALGRLDHRAFVAVNVLEDGHSPPAEKVSFAEQALAEFPNLAPLHLFRGKNLVALDQRTQAAAAYRKGLACVEEPDVRTRLLVELAVCLDLGEERTRLLKEAVDLRGNLVSSATADLILQQGTN